MGIELISVGEASTEAWYDYLHTDLDITFRHWDEDPNKSNFIVGVGNSDSHCWHYLVEDLTFPTILVCSFPNIQIWKRLQFCLNTWLAYNYSK